MNIVHIEDFFHPDAGYQVNILSKKMAALGHKVFVITSEITKMPNRLKEFFDCNDLEKKDRHFQESTGVSIIRVPIIGYVSGRSIFSIALYKIVRNLHPDILYVHGNDTLVGMQYTLRAKREKFPVIMDSHMLEMASENPFSRGFRYIYKLTFAPIIASRKIIVIRTQDDDYINRCLGVPIELTPWIPLGTDLSIFSENIEVKKKFRAAHGISMSDRVAIYVGKLDKAKGGDMLAKAFLNKFENARNVQSQRILLVVGNPEGEYGEAVREIFDKSQNKILMFPTQKYQDLASFYQVADFALFPKQCSLSFFDAQACGLPVIAESNNINIDRLKYNNGLVFESNEVESLRVNIQHMYNLSPNDFNTMKMNAIEYVTKNYNYDLIVNRYMEVVFNVINAKNMETVFE